MVKKVIIDCDVGVDDALALILAFHSPELEVKAVTGVNGNVPLETVFTNIQKVLSLIQPRQKPLIAKGADQPLKGQALYAHSVHGKSGLGEAKIDLEKGKEWWKGFPGSASELITKFAREFPGELTLIATGPLTNLALGLQKDIEGIKKLKEIVIMGGAVRTKGNVTPYAEFNIYVDPLAAKIVFGSRLPITLVPLDVTHQVCLTPSLIEERIRPINNPFSKFTIDAIGYDLDTHRFRRGTDLIYLHDPLAVGVAVKADLVKKERLSLDVETQQADRLGQILEAEGTPNTEVCLEVDSKGFLNLFLSRLG
jgi:inosine-uridine nucleoside N-ribohydrolase